jgi:hypothetical protein
MQRPVTYDELAVLSAALPAEVPFTTADAGAAGIGPHALGRMQRAGVVRRLVKGVHVVDTVPDSLEMRCAALRLVVPDGAVVSDRTAGWLHGAPMILAPNDHLQVPRVSAFHRVRGGRLRNELAASGQRMMPDSDVVQIFGLMVTTQLRTALDLGRLLRRDQAFAALDQLHGLGGFSVGELVATAPRFRGQRGVCQLRELAPLVDGRAESPGESILRLRWLDCPDLPRPEPQVEVPGPDGAVLSLDLGAEEHRFGAEYDGEEWHGEDQAPHDERRRAWVRNRLGWTLPVFRKEHVHGRGQDVQGRLRREFHARTRRLGS